MFALFLNTVDYRLNDRDPEPRQIDLGFYEEFLGA